MQSMLEIVEKQRLVRRGRCSECGSNKLVTDRSTGEVICRTCGLVLQEQGLDLRPEWRAYTLEEQRSKVRVGSPTSLTKFDKGLSTTFQPYKDSFGKALPVKERLKMLRLRKWNLRARMHSSEERNLSQAMNEMTLLADKLHIPSNIVEDAALIYRKALEKDLIRGRSIKAIIAASLYAACRLTRTPRSLKEIVESSTRSRKEITRCYRLIQRELDIKMPIDVPEKYVSKIASSVRLSQKTQNLALELLQRIKIMWGNVGKAPSGVAAAALYVASRLNDEKSTQKTLAKAADVTEVTVRNRYKRLLTDLGLQSHMKKRSMRVPRNRGFDKQESKYILNS